MAFTFDAKTSSSASSTGLTVSHTAAAGTNLLVCGIAIRGNQTITSITYGGAALTLAVETGLATDFERTAIYYKVSNATGANNLVVALSASVQHGVSISSWTAGSTPSLDVVGSANGTSLAVAASVSGATGGMATDMASTEANNATPFSANGADQTVLHNVTINASNSFGMGSSYELSPAAAEQFDWTENSGAAETWAHVVAVFKEGAAAVVLPMLTMEPMSP